MVIDEGLQLGRQHTGWHCVIGSWSYFIRFRDENYPEVLNDGSYSILKACMGDMEAARLAGIMAAKNEHTASAPAATARAGGSQEVTP